MFYNGLVLMHGNFYNLLRFEMAKYWKNQMFQNGDGYAGFKWKGMSDLEQVAGSMGHCF